VHSPRITRAVLASALLLVLGVSFALLALGQFRATTQRLRDVLSEQAEVVILVERLRLVHERIGRTARTYLLTGDGHALDEMTDARDRFDEIAAELARRDGDGRLGAAIRGALDLQDRYDRAFSEILSARVAPEAEAVAALNRTLQPLRRELTHALGTLGREVDARFRTDREEAAAATDAALRFVCAVATVLLVVAIGLTFAVTRALTLLARSQAESQRSYDRLEIVNRDLDAFAGRIAHDLRNVLAPLALLTRRLRHSPDAVAVGRTADQLDALGYRAARLIESLLAFARGGASTANSAVGSVADAVREAAADVAPLATELSVTIAVEVEDVRVRCPPALLYTVVSNLVGNAVKFVAGCSQRDVAVVARAIDGRCEIAVSDTGPGIPAEWRARVFEPFVRVPGTTAAGSGIGLATVHRIVRAHGGVIVVRSDPGEGTTIVVQLPLASDSPLAASSAAARA
jgi:signal transduction histidine kinase